MSNSNPLPSQNPNQKQKNNKKSHSSYSTINPCNQFLITYLLKLRHQQSHSTRSFNNSYKNRNDHQYHLYTRAMDSIKKYPLPIICEEQLGLLAGIGDCLIKKLIIGIKEYYRKYLKNGGNGNVQQKQQQQQQKGNNRKVQMQENNFASSNACIKNNKTFSWVQQYSSVKSIKSADDALQQFSDSSDCQSQKRDKLHPFPLTSLKPSFHTSKSQSQSQSSPCSSSNNYKPRSNTHSHTILKLFHLLDGATNSLTKKDIDKAALQNGYDKIKQWKKNIQALVKAEYIQRDPSVDNQAYFITAKGVAFMEDGKNQEIGKARKIKIMKDVTAFQARILQRQKEQQMNSQSQSMSQSQSQSFSCQQNSSNAIFQSSQQTSILKPFISSIIQSSSSSSHPSSNPYCPPPLYLVIDSRQLKNHTDRTYFQQVLTQKYKINVITQTLSLADFLFVCNGQVLDCIIERKQADDLAASVIDGRYREQKYRLMNCGAKNVMYLYQGHPSEDSPLKQKQLHNALLKTRVSNGFKIIKTSKPPQTAKFLSLIYSQLQKSLTLTPQSLFTLGTLQQYNKRNSKSRNLTLHAIFGLGLKSIRNCGRQTVISLLKYFKCYAQLYKELKKYQNVRERVEFLGLLTKGGRVQVAVLEVLVKLMFDQEQGQRNKRQYGEQQDIYTQKIGIQREQVSSQQQSQNTTNKSKKKLSKRDRKKLQRINILKVQNRSIMQHLDEEQLDEQTIRKPYSQ